MKKEKQTEYDLLKPGDVFEDEHGTVRLMTTVEGYVVVRRPGCLPFVASWPTFSERFKRIPPPAETA